MLFDSNLLFSNNQSLSGTNVSASTTSSVINLTNARDLGIGEGQSSPRVAVFAITGITSACASTTLSIQFQGSTDSTNWTTYIETPAATTTSMSTSSKIADFEWPHRAAGAALPTYVRLQYAFAAGTTATVSAGIVWAGVLLDTQANPVGLYPSGFSVS